tara:strand:- start:86 stop:304 length:219 start_codon:yes stop_codon:yes gene_type:complete
MAQMVSPCCGDEEYSDSYENPNYTKEDYDTYQYICSICLEGFNEPIEDYEYNEQMREAIAEAYEDEKRDLGL